MEPKMQNEISPDEVLSYQSNSLVYSRVVLWNYGLSNWDIFHFRETCDELLALDVKASLILI